MMTIEIRKLLVISTEHLPEWFFITEDYGSQVNEGQWGTIVHELKHGALLWVPNNPELQENNFDGELPAEVLNVQLFARAHDCDWVMFDSDADQVEGLASWDWVNPEYCEADGCLGVLTTEGKCLRCASKGCGHSACSQHYIDTGERVCLEELQVNDGPPYDAATATGMYDHDDSN
jgi:hypothetical protein